MSSGPRPSRTAACHPPACPARLSPGETATAAALADLGLADGDADDTLHLGAARVQILPDGTTLKLCRLRYHGSAHQWGFAIYRASHDDYDPSVFATGSPTGTCEDALDLACGLYLGDPTAWT